MPLPIVRLVLSKVMDLAYKAIRIELTQDLMFTKYQADLRCLANQNKADNGQRHRVSHPVYMVAYSGYIMVDHSIRPWHSSFAHEKPP